MPRVVVGRLTYCMVCILGAVFIFSGPFSVRKRARRPGRVDPRQVRRSGGSVQLFGRHVRHQDQGVMPPPLLIGRGVRHVIPRRVLSPGSKCCIFVLLSVCVRCFYFLCVIELSHLSFECDD